MTSEQGVEIFPIIAFLIFFLFFLGLIVMVIRMKRSHIEQMSNIPLTEEVVEPLKRPLEQ